MTKKKNGAKRTDEQRAYDLELTSELYLKGLKQIDIVAAINNRAKDKYGIYAYAISRSQICLDLAQIRNGWRDAGLFNMNERINMELARLDMIESAAWEGWLRSKEPRKTLSEKSWKDTKPKNKEKAKKNDTEEEMQEVIITETTKKLEESVGDPRFLAIAIDCHRQRCILLGIKTQLTPDGGEESEKTIFNVNVPKLKSLDE